VIDTGFEKDEDGNVVPIDPWKLLERGGSKGTKITSKFIKHADSFGFPDFPQGFSFWAWRTDVKQFQVDVVQNCTKTVNFIECHEKDTERMYQTKYLLSQKEVERLMELFDNITKKTNLLTMEQFMKNLYVFGINWPANRSTEDIPREFKKKMKDYFYEACEDDDNSSLSMDEFFLLFMRLQTKLDDLNDDLKEELKELHMSLNEEIKIEGEKKRDYIQRWRVEQLKLRTAMKKEN